MLFSISGFTDKLIALAGERGDFLRDAPRRRTASVNRTIQTAPTGQSHDIVVDLFAKAGYNNGERGADV